MGTGNPGPGHSKEPLQWKVLHDFHKYYAPTKGGGASLGAGLGATNGGGGDGEGGSTQALFTHWHPFAAPVIIDISHTAPWGSNTVSCVQLVAACMQQ